jgi:hypothetical protein
MNVAMPRRRHVDDLPACDLVQVGGERASIGRGESPSDDLHVIVTIEIVVLVQLGHVVVSP